MKTSFRKQIILLFWIVLSILCGCGNKQIKETTDVNDSNETSEAFTLRELAQMSITKVIEEYDDSSFQPSDVVIDRIIPGSFSQKSSDELLILCRILHLPHAGGLKTTVALIVDQTMLRIVATEIFRCDDIQIERLNHSGNPNRILIIKTSTYQGISRQEVQLFEITEGGFTLLPIDDLEDLHGEYYCFFADESLIVTSHFEGPFSVDPSLNIVKILIWNSTRGTFTLKK